MSKGVTFHSLAVGMGVGYPQLRELIRLAFTPPARVYGRTARVYGT